MSHFTVAVFTTNGGLPVDKLLDPYDEAITVEPYVRHTKAELIKQEREYVQKAFDGSYAEWRKDPAKYEAKCTNPKHIEYLKTIPDRMQWTDEQVYQEAAKHYEESLNANGDVISTYNPKSKWDWYEIGGRWKDMLLLKNGSKCDEALVSEIDFEAMSERDAAKLMPYAEAVKKPCFVLGVEYKRKLFRDEAEYFRLNTTFETWAVITPDGRWHSSGEMYMFAVTSATPEEQREWTLSYHERFIKPAIEKGWHMTIVDCHI